MLRQFAYVSYVNMFAVLQRCDAEMRSGTHFYKWNGGLLLNNVSVNCLITGSAVALHCCKAYERINRKTGNSTPCKIVTPVNFSSKVCTRDYVGDGNYCAIFL